MKLHANAALSLNQRRRLARRLVDGGWSVTKAAEAAEVSDRTAAKVGDPVSRRGRAWAARPLVGAVGGRQPHR